MPVPELLSQGELKAMFGVIIDDVKASDLPDVSKKICIEALEHLHPWLASRLYRRVMN